MLLLLVLDDRSLGRASRLDNNKKKKASMQKRARIRSSTVLFASPQHSGGQDPDYTKQRSYQRETLTNT